jgi:acetylxylan esterase
MSLTLQEHAPMSNRLRFAGPGVALVLASLLAPAGARAQACDQGWQCNVGYGASTPMDLYVPKLPAATPPVVVVLHYCGGHAADVHSWLQSYADQYGFLLITPTAGGNCFDATPTRAGERANVASMVNYTVTQKSADPTRVYVMGASSGACMTQALLAAYPDVFAAGSSLAGVPAGAWTGGNTYAWSTSGGGMPTTAQGWGDVVRNADKGFTGTRPRVQLWHGMGDTTLTYSQTYPLEVEQWTNVFGVTSAGATTTSVKPSGAMDTWARTSYKDTSGTVVVEANSGPSNVDHDLAGRGLWTDVVRFFGLDGSTPGSGGAGGAGAGAGGALAGNGGAGAGGRSDGGGGVSSGGRSDGAGGVSPGGNGNTSGTSGTSGRDGNSAGVGGMPATGGRGNTAGRSDGGAPPAGASNQGGRATVIGGASGALGSADATNTGGETAAGGKPRATGGSSAGEARGTGGSTATASSGSGASGAGCGCRVAPRENSSLGAFTALLAAALAFARRRERKLA